MRNYLLFIWIFLVSQQQMFGQVRNEFWTKLNMNKKINNKWIVGGDIQYRTQENYYIQDRQIFRHSLLQSIRTTIYYKAFPKYDIEILASPLVYFRSFYIDKQGDIKDSREMRVAMGAMQTHTFWEKIKFRNRLQYEMRFMKIDAPEQFLQNRVRWQVQTLLPICQTSNKKSCGINYIIFNEIFFANETNNIFFEQNRIYNAIQFKYKWAEWNIGYQRNIQNLKGEITERNQVHISANLMIE